MLKWFDLTSSVFAAETKKKDSKTYKCADKLFLRGIEIAMNTNSWVTCASLRLNYVRFIWRFMNMSDSKSILWEHLDWIIHKMPIRNARYFDEATHLKKQIAESDTKALREAVAAMDAGQKNWNFGGGGASGHWYECPNGHPYFIGDCGGAMVTSTCPECGEEIGGSNHRALGSNRAWRGLGN